jgi:putative two-component system response regulator
MKWQALGDIRLLVTDDDEFNRQLVVSLLGKIPSITFFQAENGEETLEILAENPIDMVLLDLHMPKMDGYATLKAIKENRNYDSIPVAIVTTDEKEMNKLYLLGADDFISKPFKLTELESRIYAHIEKRKYQQKYNQLSQKEIQKTLIESKENEKKDKEELPLQKDKERCHTLEEIEKAQKEIFYNLSKLLNSQENFSSIKIVAILAKALSLLIGYKKDIADNLYHATIIKNIGISSIKEKLPLNYQPSKKDKELHYKCMLASYQLLDNAIETDFIRISKKIITQYNEHFDGSGFPQQRQAKQIHNFAYIVAITETFMALLSNDDYLNKKRHTTEETYEIINQQMGKRFHPKITQLFLEHFKYFIQLREKLLNTLHKKEYSKI